jgi:hypothetical protein
VDTALVTITRGSNTVPTLGDLDGDGDLDLIVGESSGWLNYYRNTGTRERPVFTLVSDEYDGIKVGRRSAPLLLDLDRDGDLDLIVGSELDGLAVFRNLGRWRRRSGSGRGQCGGWHGVSGGPVGSELYRVQSSKCSHRWLGDWIASALHASQ